MAEDETHSQTEIKARVENLGWKFSAIDGDPVLGLGVKCYATAWITYPNVDKAIYTMTTVARKLSEYGISVKRMKVELVVFDVLNPVLQ